MSQQPAKATCEQRLQRAEAEVISAQLGSWTARNALSKLRSYLQAVVDAPEPPNPQMLAFALGVAETGLVHGAPRAEELDTVAAIYVTGHTTGALAGTFGLARDVGLQARDAARTALAHIPPPDVAPLVQLVEDVLELSAALCSSAEADDGPLSGADLAAPIREVKQQAERLVWDLLEARQQGWNSDE